MRNILLWIFIFSITCSSLSAHESVAAGWIVSGLLHPVFWLDHLFAMVSVGIVSAKIWGKYIWSIPSSFVVFMLIWWILWVYNNSLIPYLELGIGFSVLLLWISIALDKKYLNSLSVLFAAMFWVFHWYAHGIEMPYIPKPELYFLGFLISTIFLHILGVMFWVFIKPFKNQKHIFTVLWSLIILAWIYFIIY